MELRLAERCKYCGKIPRSLAGKQNVAVYYPGYCSYDHQERHRLQMAREYLRGLRRTADG